MTSMNKVEFNKSQIFTAFTPEIQNKIRCRKKQEIQQKTERVELRKAIHDEYQLNKKNFDVMKHDLAKNCLDYYRNLKKQLNLISMWKKNWISIIYVTLIEKNISEYTRNKYYEKRKYNHLAFGLKKFQLRCRGILKETGEDREERTKTEIKMLDIFSR